MHICVYGVNLPLLKSSQRTAEGENRTGSDLNDKNEGVIAMKGRGKEKEGPWRSEK